MRLILGFCFVLFVASAIGCGAKSGGTAAPVAPTQDEVEHMMDENMKEAGVKPGS